MKDWKIYPLKIFAKDVNPTILKIKCECEKAPVHESKKVYVIRRREDGGFNKDTMFFTFETAKKHANRTRRFYEENIRDKRRTFDTEYYLVECEIVERKIIS
jgi:hypothetical protein